MLAEVIDVQPLV